MRLKKIGGIEIRDFRLLIEFYKVVDNSLNLAAVINNNKY
jgi:hypothetical protein